MLGGKPVRTKDFQPWPVATDEDAESVVKAVRSGHWNRGQCVSRFEEAYAKLNGAKYCLAISSGTNALFASLAALDVGPGDEVIVPPYTFMATVNVALLHYAMPVFVDTDRETFLMDSRKLEAAITDRTAAIIPVHIGGATADLDNILAIAKKHGVPVIEDACQAHLGQWRGRNVGTWGKCGCFSFQQTKNMASGEGGAILTNDESMADKCYAFHNCGRKRGALVPPLAFDGGFASNLRMTELQGALLLAQLTQLERNAITRSENAQYLTSMLREIPGIVPAKMYDGCTNNAYHLYMLRYQPEQFAGLSRERFLQALGAEGIPCSDGYGRLNRAPWIRNTLKSRPFARVFGKTAIERWQERNQCPENDRLCQEAVWFFQNMLLGPRGDMDQIAEAVHKIQASAATLAKA